MGFAFSGMITVIGTIRKNAMNARIKELAEQAGIYKLNLSDETEYWIVEKFAELIVKECAGIIELQDVDPSFKLRMSWAVKEYFGVTE